MFPRPHPAAALTSYLVDAVRSAVCQRDALDAIEAAHCFPAATEADMERAMADELGRMDRGYATLRQSVVTGRTASC